MKTSSLVLLAFGCCVAAGCQRAAEETASSTNKDEAPGVQPNDSAKDANSKPDDPDSPEKGVKLPANAETISAEQLAAEIEKAGAGVALETVDLSRLGLNFTIQAPANATVETFKGGIEISKNASFGIRIALGTEHLALLHSVLASDDVIAGGPDWVFCRQSLSEQPSYRFGSKSTQAFQDVYIGSLDVVNLELAEFTRDDCLLMMKCAQTLAAKNPLPSDPAEALAQLGARLERDAADKVTEIYLDADQSTNATLALLKDFAELAVLDASGGKHLTNEALAHVADLAQLEVLNLSATSIDDNALGHLRKLKLLQSLTLDNTFVSGAGLAALGELPDLRQVDLNGAPLTDAGMAGVAKLASLEELGLRHVELTGDGLSHLRTLPSLQSIQLDFARIDDAGLAQLRDLATIRELSLNQTGTTDRGAASLASLAGLRQLSLSETKIGDEGVAHLTGLENLESLTLDQTRITDAGVRHLAKLPKLTTLNLNRTRIGDGSVDVLRSLEQLTTLGLSRTKIKYPAAERLKDALKNTTVFHSFESD